MKHHQLPSDKDHHMSKDMKKADHSNKKKERKISAENSLASKPKVGRVSKNKPSNRKIDAERFLDKKMKHLKTFENFECPIDWVDKSLTIDDIINKKDSRRYK